MHKNNQSNRFKLRLSSLAVISAFSLPIAAHAISLDNISLLATGSYVLGSDPIVQLSDNGPSAYHPSVNVVEFPSSGVNSAVLHSYGAPYGDFGSRSSGVGKYDVRGSFLITGTFTNTTATAQHAYFNFDITPGDVSNQIHGGLSTGEYVESGINFSVKRNGSEVWGSSANLKTDNLGTTFNSTGANLYSGSGTYYDIHGGAQAPIDLGVLNAGESITLSYELSTFATGNSVAGDVIHHDAQHYTLPEQVFVDFCGECFFGYGGGYGGDAGYGGAYIIGQQDEFIDDGYGGGFTITRNVYRVPAHDVDIPAYDEIVTSPSGSEARSGDPFDIDFNGNVVDAFSPYYVRSFTNGLSITLAPVPEPETYALMLAGLGLIGFQARRKKLSNPLV